MECFLHKISSPPGTYPLDICALTIMGFSCTSGLNSCKIKSHFMEIFPVIKARTRRNIENALFVACKQNVPAWNITQSQQL